MATISLQELAERFALRLIGSGDLLIEGVCTLAPGRPGHLSFLSNPKLRPQLAATRASAVIVAERDLELVAGAALVARDPYLAYARIAKLFDPDRAFTPGQHTHASVDAAAVIGAGCWIGPGAVIEAGARLGEGVYVGPNCVIGRDAQLGADCRLVSNVQIGARVRIGLRCVFQPGAVIGGRGFGNARGPQGWEEVPQLGSVLIGNDVEVGANTCIDRGAIEDTVIEDGVRLDNLIQVAHNCHIGAHTAIAACTGIAGSVRIGRRCMIAGGVGISGHLEIADDVVLLGFTMVTSSIRDKGIYGSGMPQQEARDWRKTVARMRRLGRLEARLKAMERRLGSEPADDAGDEQDDV